MDRSLEARVRKHDWLERHSRAFPLVVFALSVALVVVGAVASETSERAAISERLEVQEVELKQAIMRQEAAYDAVLQVGALFLSQVDSGTEQFEQFVRAAALSIDIDGARGVGWAFVSDDGTGKIASVKITYLSPSNSGNRSAIGFDMYREQKRRDAIDRAIATGKPTTTAPVVLMQDLRRRPKLGFLVYKPVPTGGKLPKGMVYVAFRGDDFLQSQLSAISHPPSYAALYDGPIAASNLLAEAGDKSRNLFSRSTQLDFGNTQWTLVIAGAPPAMLSSFTKWFIFVGLIISGMLLFITRMLVRAAAHDRDAFEWQFRQLQIRKTLNRELNHRVKNTLANVLSILALTKRRSATLDEFADSLAARIRALSATHGLLTQNEWSNADIRDVFEAELAPFLHSAGPVIAIAGPNIKLAPNIALSLGLAVHELATNAAKYGALTAATGRVDIVWRSIGDRKAGIIWSETGGPPVKPPDRRGFGLELLESIMSQEFSGAAKLEFLPTGLCCQLSVPVGPLPKAVTPLPI